MKKIIYLCIAICCFTACTKPDQDELSVEVAIPNAFRPVSKDGTMNSAVPCVGGWENCNSVFIVSISNPNNISLKVEIRVYDQNGRTLFYSTSLNAGWDGTEHNTGSNFCPQGNYHYQVKVTEVSAKRSRLFEGDIALLR